MRWLRALGRYLAARPPAGDVQTARLQRTETASKPLRLLTDPLTADLAMRWDAYRAQAARPDWAAFVDGLTRERDALAGEAAKLRQGIAAHHRRRRMLP